MRARENFHLVSERGERKKEAVGFLISRSRAGEKERKRRVSRGRRKG